MTYQPHQAEDTTLKTPGAQWREKGEADPHGTRYECERAALAMGHMSDDEVANGAFLNYDNFDARKLLARTPGYYPPISWMTAVKDRIRWLSRAFEKERAANAALRRAMQPMDPQAARAAAADMRAEFEAWVRDRGCDTDGAWSAWQAAWNRRTPGVPGTLKEQP